MAYALLSSLGYTLFVYPLKSLYFLGPSFSGVGGWGGTNAADICSQITQVPASHWINYSEVCSELLERKFSSFLVLFFCSAYLWTLYKILNYLWFRYFVFGPLIAELKTVLPTFSQQEKVNELSIKIDETPKKKPNKP
jgi:hypothetical protein